MEERVAQWYGTPLSRTQSMARSSLSQPSLLSFRGLYPAHLVVGAKTPRLYTRFRWASSYSVIKNNCPSTCSILWANSVHRQEITRIHDAPDNGSLLSVYQPDKNNLQWNEWIHISADRFLLDIEYPHKDIRQSLFIWPDKYWKWTPVGGRVCSASYRMGH